MILDNTIKDFYPDTINMTFPEFDRNKRIKDFVKYQENRILQAIKIKGGCETIDNNRMLQILQRKGYGMIAPYDGRLYFFSEANWGGKLDQLYRPTRMVGTNPFLNYSYDLEVDKNCVLIRNDHNNQGFSHIFFMYGRMLADNEISMAMASINARISTFIQAGTDTDKEEALNYLKDIYDGKFGVIGSQDFFERIQFASNSTASGVLTNLIEYEQYLKASCMNEIGLSSNYNMKREAINSDESQMGEDAFLPLIQDSLEALTESFDKVNEMYGEYLDEPFSVDLANTWKVKENAVEQAIENPEGGEDSETDDAIPVMDD